MEPPLYGIQGLVFCRELTLQIGTLLLQSHHLGSRSVGRRSNPAEVGDVSGDLKKKEEGKKVRKNEKKPKYKYFMRLL